MNSDNATYKIQGQVGWHSDLSGTGFVKVWEWLRIGLGKARVDALTVGTRGLVRTMRRRVQRIYFPHTEVDLVQCREKEVRIVNRMLMVLDRNLYLLGGERSTSISRYQKTGDRAIMIETRFTQ